MNESKVLAGAEAFYAEGNRTGILVIHGYTGTPQSLRPLAEAMAQAGYTVALPRLTGHGTIPADMATATASEWVADVETALDWLQQSCDTLFVTGLSLGGTLTLYLAGRYPTLLAGIIPINAPVFLNQPALASFAYQRGGPAEIPGLSGDIKAPGITELSYPVVPVPTIKEAAALLKITEELLPCVTCPALLVVSREDHIVPPANGEYILGRIASEQKRLLWLEESYHVATLDNDKEQILQESLAFIKMHT